MEEDFFQKTLMGIYDYSVDLISNGTTEQVADALYGLDQAKREIGELLERAKDRLIADMGESQEMKLQGRTFEKKVGAPRKSWDHKTLADVVSTRISDMSIDMETGEVLKTPKEMVEQMIEFCGISYWRVKELSKIGINADNYCEVGEPKTNIIIRDN
jgi:hypothetical protein